MKNIILFIAIIVFSSFKPLISEKSPSTLQDKKITLEIDVDKTRLSGEEVIATFYIQNNSDEEIYILKPSFGSTNLDFFSAEIECGLQFASTSDGTTFKRSLDELILIKPNTKEKFTISGDHYVNLTCVEGSEDKFKLQLIYNYEDESNHWIAEYKEENPDNYAEINSKVYKGKIASKMTTIQVKK